MTQTQYVLAVLGIAFLLFITAKGELGAYIQLLV